MVYEYRCIGCEKSQDIYKSVEAIERPELCLECGDKMERQMVFKGQLNAQNFEAHYNQAFGKIVHSKNELKESVRVHNETHGTDLQEIGTERYRAHKPEFKVDTESMKKEIYGVLRK